MSLTPVINLELLISSRFSKDLLVFFMNFHVFAKPMRYIFAFKFTLRSQQRKFAAGVIDTGGNLPPVSLPPAENLRIFEKIGNGPYGIPWGWGETDS
jgi:hypothetical protein